MTALHITWLASIAGALLFFAAGLVTMTLRRSAVAAPRTSETTALHARVVRAETEAREAATARARAELAMRDLASERAQWQRDAAARIDAAASMLRRELEDAQSEATTLRRERDGALERVRDLATQNEAMKGRLRDADALRGEYVRLRTATTETEFLKSEVARLETELASTRAAALGAVAIRPQRSARGTRRPGARPTGSIGESLTSVLDRFAGAGTRSIAIGDPQGFVLASRGDDGLGLAAHAAQLAEIAGRATQFLPVGAPAVMEVIDDHGARLSVWTFTVESDRLLLASLDVNPPEPKLVEATLSDLAAVLAPTAVAQGGYR